MLRAFIRTLNLLNCSQRSDLKRTNVLIFIHFQYDSILKWGYQTWVIEMTGLKKMIGLPVIVNGKQRGSVMRGVLAQDGKTLRGLVVRGGLRGARWLPRDQIALVGNVSVIARGKAGRIPKDASYHLFRVTDPDGTRLGVVTDALINEETLRVSALEISGGPLDDLIDGRWYATAYHVQPMGDVGHVTVPTVREEVNEV